ncbi:ATP-dependent helicase [Porphyromonas crevioricanis]|uniref:DNA 3'-5' helicase n=1 Tax=Porphyromonas crevioricanis TaxID=393921 RepID=A0AB34PFD0_9PORP|nr:UvrD-helicase domain-containing protein [Porphyromonas crevioricanis]KGN94922.1 hypothetical protein HQ38_05200 [Porphyromonas crevioricanis]
MTEGQETYLDHLSPAQREAVEYISGPALVIAGAGSGKTRVLVAKVIHLLQQGLLPQDIMALTFTNKAAKEMKERISRELNMRLPWNFRVGTFHSIFLREIRNHAERLGLKSDLTVYDTVDQKSLVKLVVKDLLLDDKVYTPKFCLSRISNAKNRLIDAREYAENREFVAYDAKNRVGRFADVYSLYQSRLRASNAVDFDDILVYTNVLLRDFPDLRDEMRAQTKYLLIDEYQDTNLAQYEIAYRLMGENGKVFAVGDDAQSIYSFRGANLDNILKFQQAFPTARLFKLEENYRSTQNIVRTANRLIARNTRQIPKEIYSSRPEGDEVEVHSCYTDITEAVYISEQLSELHQSEHISFAQMAVLYRTNAQSRLLEQELRKKSIPFHIHGGMSFFSYKEIKDIMAYLKLIVNPDDEEAIYRTINFPRRGIGDTTIAKLRVLSREKGLSLSELIASPARMSEANIQRSAIVKISGYVELLDRLRQMAQDDLTALVREVMSDTGIADFYFGDKSVEGISRQENIRELLSGIAQYQEAENEDGRVPTLTSFLNDMALLTDQDRSDEEEDQVTLMTIHAAKGLEFPYVFVVGLEENLFPSSLCNTPGEMEEERRLLYVAITRAKEKCVLTFAHNRYQSGRSEMRAPSRFIKELQGEGCRTAGKLSNLGVFSGLKDQYGNGQERPEWMLRPATDMEHAPEHQPKTSGRKLRRISSGGNLLAKSFGETQEGETEDFAVGDRVLHSRFGAGVVTSLDGLGSDARATVLFDTVGQKLLLLRFAKLKRIG